MRVSTSVSRVRCASVSSAAATDVRDDLAAPRHREFGQVEDGLVGAFAAQQFDGLRQQRRGGAVDARAVEDLVQQCDSAVGRRLV